MLKKTIISVVMALLITGLAGGVAHAAGPDRWLLSDQPEQRRRTAVAGRIAGVYPPLRTFELRTRRGELLTFSVDESTRWLGQVKTYPELQVGMPAGVVARTQDDGLWLAGAVFVAPYPPRLNRFGGRVTTVDQVANTFTLESPRLGELTIAVDGETRFRGTISSLQGLEAGMPVFVVVSTTADELPLAVVVGVPRRLSFVQVRGTIAAIDHQASTLEVQTRRGDIKTIQVDVQTKFRSREGAIQGLADLEAGMVVFVVAERMEDVGFKAKGIGVLNYSGN